MCKLAGCMFVRSFERASATKCTNMHRVQAAGSKIDNFCTRMHVAKLHSLANFHPSRQRPGPLFSRTNIHIEYIGKFIREMRSKLCR